MRMRLKLMTDLARYMSRMKRSGNQYYPIDA